MRFGVLGSILAQNGDATVDLGGPQQRRLLGALLVARGGAVSVDRLVDVLWPDGNAPPGAERSAMSYVSRLRSTLGDGALQTVPAGYRLDGVTDADEFEEGITAAQRALPDEAVGLYDTALALWRGSAFGELASEWWALAESSRLDER